MEITKEKIQERLQTLKTNVEQLQGHINALGGAVQDCEYWLSVLDQLEPEQEVNDNSPD